MSHHPFGVDDERQASAFDRNEREGSHLTQPAATSGRSSDGFSPFVHPPTAQELGIYSHVTPFNECHDVLSVVTQFCDLHTCYNLRAVNQLWGGVVSQTLEGKRGEIRDFVEAFNEAVEFKRNAESSISRGSKIRLIMYSGLTLPGAILPLLFSAVNRSYAGVTKDPIDTTIGSCLFAGCGLIYIGGHIFSEFVLYPYYHVAALTKSFENRLLAIVVSLFYHALNTVCLGCFFALFLLPSQRFDVDGSGESIGLLLLRAAAGLSFMALPFYSTFFAAILFIYITEGLRIHREQIRNPLSSDSAENSNGYFISMRRVVTLNEVEEMMSAWHHLRGTGP